MKVVEQQMTVGWTFPGWIELREETVCKEDSILFSSLAGSEG